MGFGVGDIRRQAGVATLDQLERSGLSPARIRANVDARRWRRFGERCVLLHNSTPSRAQWIWIAMLDYPGPVALAGLTALQSVGFTFFGRELELIHVVGPRGTRYHRFPDVKVHESRRFSTADIHPESPIPRTFVSRSALDAAAWQPYPRYACAVLAAVVQQRLCTAHDLATELPLVGRIRHKAHMRLALQDIAGGAEALSELDIATMCRDFGLPAPDRQRVRRDSSGRRRYLDCEWLLSGHLVVLEVDGAHHMRVQHWNEDMKRERRVVISGRRVLRATAYEARNEPAELARDLRSMGI